MPRSSPYQLWLEAEGDRERYRALLREHGLIRDLQPGENPTKLPCGWPRDKDKDSAQE